MNATVLSFLRHRAFYRASLSRMTPWIRDVERKLYKEFTDNLRAFKTSDIN